jgi:hypothetical protein
MEGSKMKTTDHVKVEMGTWQFAIGGWQLDGKGPSRRGNYLIYTQQQPSALVWINEIDLAWLIFENWRRADGHEDDV